ncbi:MAG: hypothetical protein JWO38_2877 [Gemmataceae bacterium]|nr:hypothetical protein [Gemmataceae bacterium]
MPNPIPGRPLVVLALAAGFALAHTQSPLFYSNQNQYLLHGLADAGYGHLRHDWLATTKDPTPVFSAGVAAAYRGAGLWPLQGAFLVLLMGYFASAWWLVSPLPGVTPSSRTALGFAALFTAAHAAIFRLFSVWLTGVDYPWFLQAGLAGQYVLGPGLQPSALGVLLVGSLAAFANGRPHLAAALAAGSAVLHATYLLPAALLALGYMTALGRSGQWRAAAGVGAVALSVALPVVVYTLVVFPPSSAGVFAESQQILAEVRIPHHAVVGRWLDGVAVLQLGWVALGLFLLRTSRLFLPLLIPAVGALVLTLVQVGTGDHTLALLFPWRVSAVLVPVATAAVVINIVNRRTIGLMEYWMFVALLVAAVAGGVAIMALGLGYRMNEDERAVLEYVRNNAGPDDVYLIPTRIPQVGTGPRGSVSTSFTPPPRPKPGSNLIPVDLQRFRLATGAPIYVDFKSVPYADVEVLEWRRRVRRVEAWYDEPDWDRAGVRDQLRAEGITHVLVPRAQAVRTTFLEPVHADDAYTVYRVK